MSAVSLIVSVVSFIQVILHGHKAAFVSVCGCLHCSDSQPAIFLNPMDKLPAVDRSILVRSVDFLSQVVVILIAGVYAAISELTHSRLARQLPHAKPIAAEKKLSNYKYFVIYSQY